MLINNYKATPIPSSQSHAKLNKKEILSAFVIVFTINTLIIFENIVVVLIARFVLAKILFIVSIIIKTN